ncbi:hypothetical protein ABG067_001921 [Albugo candida]
MMGVTKWYLIRTQADNMSKIGIALQFLHFDLLSYLHTLSLVRNPRLSADEVSLIVSAGTSLTVARKVERVRLGSLQVIFDKVQMQSSIIRHDVVCVLNVSPLNTCLALKEAYHYVHFGAFEVALRLDHRDSHLIACTSNGSDRTLAD